MMRAMLSFARRLRDNVAGSMLIETAFVVPALAGMALAGVEVSTMIVRQHELQAMASNAAEIVINADPNGEAEVAELTTDVANWLAAASGLTKVATISGTNQVAVVRVVRCGNSLELKELGTACPVGSAKAVYIRIRMVERHEPLWGDALDIGQSSQFRVQRLIRIG